MHEPKASALVALTNTASSECATLKHEKPAKWFLSVLLLITETTVKHMSVRLVLAPNRFCHGATAMLCFSRHFA